MRDKRKCAIEVVDETDCWIWQGPIDGYGIPISTEKGRVFRVSQRYYFNKYGVTLKRIKKSCGNKLCLNPEHMKEDKKQKQIAITKETDSYKSYLEEALKTDTLNESEKVEIRRELEKISST